MNIPNFIDMRFTDKEGKLTSEWKTLFMELFSSLQKNLSDQTGIVVPKQSTENTNLIGQDALPGTLIYDETTHQLKVKINNVLKTIQTT